MQPETTEALTRERRSKLVNLKDPEIIELWTRTKEVLAPIIKPGVDLDITTEEMVLQTLLYSSKDKLSGLSNKARFRVEVEAAMAVSRKLGIPLTVLGMDTIGFKEINDGLGHPKGDEVIAATGAALRENTRPVDFTIVNIDKEPNIEVSRPGGDEFGAVLLGADLQGAEIVTERIQTNVPKVVNEKVPELEQTLGHPYELTIGKAQYNPDIHHSAEDLIKAADDNLTQIRHQNGQPRRS